MEAKDTVMGGNQIAAAIKKAEQEGLPYPSFSEIVTRAQAEISFKAGIGVGRREVVDFIGKHASHSMSGTTEISFYGGRWQAKLKEWGD